MATAKKNLLQGETTSSKVLNENMVDETIGPKYIPDPSTQQKRVKNGTVIKLIMDSNDSKIFTGVAINKPVLKANPPTKNIGLDSKLRMPVGPKGMTSKHYTFTDIN